VFFHPLAARFFIEPAIKQDVNSPRGNREAVSIEFIAKDVFHYTI
jgi:hypothetical protein